MVHMTVGELKKALEGVPDDRIVLVGDETTAVDVVDVTKECDAGDNESAFLISIDETLGETHVKFAAGRKP